MAYMHAVTREWVQTIVYWGPGLSGKTSSVKWLSEHAPPTHRGRLQRLATETQHPATFEFLPLSLGMVHGVSLRLHVYTTFGHISFDKTRLSLAKLADGVVFVADSHPDRQDANRLALDELHVRLQEQETHKKPSLIVQCNKRDLPGAQPMHTIAELLDIHPSHSCVPSIARTGEGVWEALRACVRAALLDPSSRAFSPTHH